MSAVAGLPPIATPRANLDAGRRFLEDLRAEIAAHPGVNHLFLNRLATTPFSRDDYRIFGENHFPLVCVFTSYLETLLIRAPDSEAKLWLAKVLVDEYGEGSEGHDHSKLYASYLQAAGGDPAFVKNGRVPAPAAQFIATHRATGHRINRGHFAVHKKLAALYERTDRLQDAMVSRQMWEAYERTRRNVSR